MKKTLTLIIALTLSALSLSAATPWLKRPLRFVPADSVATWGYDGHDLRTLAYQTDSTIAPPYLRPTRLEWQQRKLAFKHGKTAPTTATAWAARARTSVHRKGWLPRGGLTWRANCF